MYLTECTWEELCEFSTAVINLDGQENEFQEGLVYMASRPFGTAKRSVFCNVEYCSPDRVDLPTHEVPNQFGAWHGFAFESVVEFRWTSTSGSILRAWRDNPSGENFLIEVFPSSDRNTCSYMDKMRSRTNNSWIPVLYTNVVATNEEAEMLLGTMRANEWVGTVVFNLGVETLTMAGSVPAVAAVNLGRAGMEIRRSQRLMENSIAVEKFYKAFGINIR